MYNQPNWQDVYSGKDKNIARGDFKILPSNEQMYQYRVSSAAKNLKLFNDKYKGCRSEVIDKFSVGETATHMHHIFPRHQFQEIADFIENIIALTSGQHLQRAHPNGNKSVIDKDFLFQSFLNTTILLVFVPTALFFTPQMLAVFVNF